MSVSSRQEIHTEMQRAQETFHALLAQASPADLRRASRGTRWTSQQLLFHMLFGYLIVRALLMLVRAFGLLPDRASKAIAGLPSTSTCNGKPAPPCAAACTIPQPGTRSSPAT